MKKTIFSLLLAAICCSGPSVFAQCVPTVTNAAPVVNTGQLIFAASGVNCVIPASYGADIKINFGAWTTVQATQLIFAGTGWIAVHQIAISSLHCGQVVRFRGWDNENGQFYYGPVAIYRVRNHFNMDATVAVNSRIIASERIQDELPSGPIDMHVTSSTKENILIDVSDLRSDDNAPTIDAGDFILERVTEEELLSEQTVTPFDAVSITSSGRRLNFSIPENVDFRFDLIDMNGKKCDHGHQSSNYRVHWVEYPALAPGMYIVQCTETSTGMIRSFKLMISE